MSRGMTPEFAAALADRSVRPVIFYEGTFASGVLRLWSGLGDIVWNDETWTGAGTLLGMGAIEEGDKIEAYGTSIKLSGIPLDLVQLCIEEAQQGLPGKVWVGLMEEDRTLIGDPILATSGRLDVPNLEDSEDTCSITITYEGRLIGLLQAREWRYTDESQQVLFPGDRGFEYVTTIQDKDIQWGTG
jgi:hypothetical protein